MQFNVPVNVPTAEPVKVTVTLPVAPAAKDSGIGATTKPLAPVIPHVTVDAAPVEVKLKGRFEEPVGKL